MVISARIAEPSCSLFISTYKSVFASTYKAEKKKKRKPMAHQQVMALGNGTELQTIKGVERTLQQQGKLWFVVEPSGDLKPICGAQRSKGRGRCTVPVVMHNGRCRSHGGATPFGAQSKNFKTGRWSKYIPDALRAKYQTAQTDTELLDLSHEISLTDVRLATLLERLATNENRQTWSEMLGMARTAKTLFADDGKRQIAMAQLDKLVLVAEAALADYTLWNEIGVQLETRRRLVESETKRQKELNLMISANDAMLLFARLSDIISTNVKDVDERSSIARAIEHLIAQKGPTDIIEQSTTEHVI